MQVSYSGCSAGGTSVELIRSAQSETSQRGGSPMKPLSIAAAGLAVLIAGAVPGKAATIKETYDFTATGSASSPVNPWDGSFTITFDPTASGNLGPFALDAFSSNLPASYSPFVYIQANNFIVVGDDCNTLDCVAGPNKAFLDFLVDPSGNPLSSAVAINDEFGSNLSVTLASTPLPAAFPLFASGLGALGLLGWRRKRKGAAAIAAA
jgi:hypothetical protein